MEGGVDSKEGEGGRAEAITEPRLHHSRNAARRRVSFDHPLAVNDRQSLVSRCPPASAGKYLL